MKIGFRKILAVVAAGMLLTGQSMAAESNECGKIRPGEIWKDVKGDTINAHGGCVIFADGQNGMASIARRCGHCRRKG